MRETRESFEPVRSVTSSRLYLFARRVREVICLLDKKSRNLYFVVEVPELLFKELTVEIISRRINLGFSAWFVNRNKFDRRDH